MFGIQHRMRFFRYHDCAITPIPIKCITDSLTSCRSPMILVLSSWM